MILIHIFSLGLGCLPTHRVDVIVLGAARPEILTQVLNVAARAQLPPQQHFSSATLSALADRKWDCRAPVL